MSQILEEPRKKYIGLMTVDDFIDWLTSNIEEEQRKLPISFIDVCYPRMDNMRISSDGIIIEISDINQEN